MIIQHGQCSGTKQSCKLWRYYTSKTTDLQPEGAATSTVVTGELRSVPVVSNNQLTINQHSFSINLIAFTATCFTLSHCRLIHGRWMWFSMSFFWVGSHSHFAICSQFISDKQNRKMYNLRVLWKLKCTSQILEEEKTISSIHSHNITKSCTDTTESSKHGL